MSSFDSRAKKVGPALAATLVLCLASTAHAAPSRVAVLGPSGAPIVPRIQRNITSMKLDAVDATVTVCTRDVVLRLVTELRVDTALCTDGDQISVWLLKGDRLVLQESVVVQGPDDRAQELAAARATMALQTLPAKDARPESGPPSSFTIVATGPTATIAPAHEDAAPLGASPPAKDQAAPRKPSAAAERITPRLVLGAGPAIAASRDGNSLAFSAEAEIGVTRHVALVPWIQFIPANRTAEAAVGTASFRPTIFGFGFAIPVLAPSSVVVPRFGAGYGVLWMHASPESATGAGTMRKPEDLLAPLLYATTAFSAKVASDFRIVAEGMVGTSTHDMVVRIGGERAAHWGVPVASAALRGEWVLQ